MADITKCEGTSCAKKRTCYRYLAKTNELLNSLAAYQSYLANHKEDCINSDYAYFWGKRKNVLI